MCKELLINLYNVVPLTLKYSPPPPQKKDKKHMVHGNWVIFCRGHTIVYFFRYSSQTYWGNEHKFILKTIFILKWVIFILNLKVCTISYYIFSLQENSTLYTKFSWHFWNKLKKFWSLNVDFSNFYLLSFVYLLY